MSDNRYNRWQGLAISQMSVAIALISGFSASGLALGFSLLQSDKFFPCGAFKVMFFLSFPLLLLAAITSAIAVVTRLLDFRLTARTVRMKQNPNYSRPLKIFFLEASTYGQITWFLFWLGCATSLCGIIFLFTSIIGTYISRL